MTETKDVESIKTVKLLTLAKLNAGDLVDNEEFEALPEAAQKDVLFLRESRLRDRRFHRFWTRYETEDRNWIREQKIYDQMAAYGRWREFKGQLGKLLFEVYRFFLVLTRKLAFWR